MLVVKSKENQNIFKNLFEHKPEEDIYADPDVKAKVQISPLQLLLSKIIKKYYWLNDDIDNNHKHLRQNVKCFVTCKSL